MTLCLLLAADAVAGTASKYDFTNLREIAALVGLVSVLLGLTSFLNAAEHRFNQTQLPDRQRGNPNVDFYLSGFAIVVGFCLFAVSPKNGWFILAPFFLLYVRRVWQAECQVRGIIRHAGTRFFGSCPMVATGLQLKSQAARRVGLCPVDAAVGEFVCQAGYRGMRSCCFARVAMSRC